MNEVAHAIERTGQRALPVTVDLAQPEPLLETVEQIAQHFGRIDVLANATATDVPGSIEVIEVAVWERVLVINLSAPFVLAKGVFPHPRAAGGGTIIDFSSVAGKRGGPNAAAYVNSKFALTGLPQVLNAEGRAHRIRATVLYPGGIATQQGAWNPEARQEREAENGIPPRSWSSP